MRRRDRLYQWAREHPLALDSAGALGALVLLAPFSAGAGGLPGLLLSVLLIAPLCVRRTRPLLSGGLVAGVAYLQVALGVDPVAADAATLAAVYALAAYAPRWASRAGLVLSLLGAPLAWLGAGDLVTTIGASVLTASLFLAAWALGDVRRSRVLQLHSLQERSRRLELERDAAARLAAADERARIAREMHDVVAHSLSVVIAQSDGGRYVAASDPARAVEALTTIGETGRAALAEMRRLLGVLSAGDGTDVRPQPGVGDLPTLLASVRGSGLPVEHMVQGHPRPLPPGESLAAYRVVQEALTNVLRHGGPGARAEVVLRWQPRCLEVAVRDDGRGAASDSAVEAAAEIGAGLPGAGQDRGRGLVGIRERVTLYGGGVSAGPRAGGGFAVDVQLPYPEERR